MARYSITTNAEQELVLQAQLATANAERETKKLPPLSATDYLQAQFDQRFSQVIAERKQLLSFELTRTLGAASLDKLLAAQQVLKGE